MVWTPERKAGLDEFRRRVVCGEIDAKQAEAIADALPLDLESLPLLKDTDRVGIPPHPSQVRALQSDRRFIAVFAGWQSGKTIIAPYWLMREMQRRGSGDYGVLGPDYPILEAKAIPLLCLWFERTGYATYNKQDAIFTITKLGARKIFGDETATGRILVRHCKRENAIEAFTVKALWVEEPGQIPDSIWTAIQPRIARHNARVLMTARPYEFNWYVREIWDSVMGVGLDGVPYRKESARDDTEVVNFSSVENPEFSKEEYDRARARMPEWEHRLKYAGIPTRPAGIVYDCFKEAPAGERSKGVPPPDWAYNTCQPFPVPREWDLFIGVDFGSINTAGVILAQERALDPWGRGWAEPTGRYFVVGAYHQGQSMETREHLAGIQAAALLPLEKSAHPIRVPLAIGGAVSETGFRDAFTLMGLPTAQPPYANIDAQVQDTYTLIKTRRLVVFDGLSKLIGDINEFARELDENLEVTRKFKDEVKYHRLAALRYVGCYVARLVR